MQQPSLAELSVNIVVYEHDRLFAAYIEQLLRQIIQIPTYISTGKPGVIEQYLDTPHRTTLYLLDLKAEDEFLMGKQLAQHIAARCPADRYLFVTGYPDDVRDDVKLALGSQLILYKRHPNFRQLFVSGVTAVLEAMASTYSILRHNGALLLLHHTEVNYVCTAGHNYLQYHLAQSSTQPEKVIRVKATGPLEQALAGALPAATRRVHKQYLVVLQNTRSWHFKQQRILFLDGSFCPLSHTYVTVDECKSWNKPQPG